MRTTLVSAAEFRANWIGAATPSNPVAGPVKIGDLYLSQTGPGGSVRVGPGSASVGAELQMLAIAERAIALPEPDGSLGLVAGVGMLALLARRRARQARRAAGLFALALVLATPQAARAAISVKDQVAIAEMNGGLNVSMDLNEQFGTSVVSLGISTALHGRPGVGAHAHRPGHRSPREGRPILFMNEDQTVEDGT
jgi:hypothetical protein